MGHQQHQQHETASSNHTDEQFDEDGARSQGAAPQTPAGQTSTESMFSSQKKMRKLTNLTHDTDDPLVLLFQIMLTGTLPTSSEKINTLVRAYECNEEQAILVAECESKARRSFGKPFRIDKEVPEKLSVNFEEDIMWCNGRCGGQANTAYCTSLCLKLWEQRVHLFRHYMEVTQIIEKHRHSDLVANPIRLPTGEVISIKPETKLHKHKVETPMQFEMRLKETLKHRAEMQRAMNRGEGESKVNVDLKSGGKQIDWSSPATRISSSMRSKKPSRASSPDAALAFPSGTLSDQTRFQSSQRSVCTDDRVERSHKCDGDVVGPSYNLPLPLGREFDSAKYRVKTNVYARATASSAVKSIARYYVRKHEQVEIYF